MWEYFKSLPNILSFALIIVIVIAAVIISIRGKLAAKVGKNQLDLGGNQTSPDTPPPTQAIMLQPTTGIYHKRTCGDCVLILMSERERYEIESKKISNKILKTQMNYFEQKLTEIQSLFIDDFCEEIAKTPNATEDDKQIQYKLFYGLFKDLLVSIKDEIRRSYKENGFSEMSDTEFSNYVKNKAKKLISMSTQHFLNLYPIKGTLVCTEKIVTLIEYNTPDMQQIVFDCFAYAKEVLIESEKETEQIRGNFSKWIDSFVR